MDMFQAMGAMNNPQAYVMQQGMQTMINQHPAEWKKAQEMCQGKSRKQVVNELRKFYKSQGQDIEAVAAQYGITL